MDSTLLPSPPSASRGRGLVSVVALAALTLLLVWQVRKLLDNPTVFPPDDFVEYWAAGKLNAHGQNPYSEELLYDLQNRETVRHEDYAVMMWNPPWTLTFVMPYGLLPARDAQLLWLMQNLVIVLVCGDWLWRLYGGPARFRWVAWLLALTFMPTLFALNAGQIPPLVLLGITLFLTFERRGWHFLAGAACVLVAIKPHLVYLFWIALAVWGVRCGRRLLLGGVVAGLAATAIPMACNPQVVTQYREAMTHRPPAQWKSPTLGSLLRDCVEQEDISPGAGAVGGGPGAVLSTVPSGSPVAHFVLQFVPTALGLAFLAWYGRRRAGRPWDWLEQTPVLLLASFITASYGAWPYDVLILLPAVMQVAAGVARRADRGSVVAGVAAFLALQVPALVLNLLHIRSNRFIWMAPTLLVMYLLLRDRTVEREAGDGPLP